MDPNTTLVKLIEDESSTGTSEAAYDLQEWLEKGGFEPDRNKLTPKQWTAMIRMFVALIREVY